MPSWIACPNDHSTKSVWIQDAAIATSEGRPIGAYRKCGKELQYRIDHVYASDPREKRDGHALDDWLQAEAEITERISLRTAA